MSELTVNELNTMQEQLNRERMMVKKVQNVRPRLHRSAVEAEMRAGCGQASGSLSAFAQSIELGGSPCPKPKKQAVTASAFTT